MLNVECKNNFEYENTILITKNYSSHFDHDKDLIGLATSYSNDNENIDFVIIQIKDMKKGVLEHEIGHALGWEDIPIEKNIMNPEWNIDNYSNVGLEKQ